MKKWLIFTVVFFCLGCSMGLTDQEVTENVNKQIAYCEGTGGKVELTVERKIFKTVGIYVTCIYTL